MGSEAIPALLPCAQALVNAGLSFQPVHRMQALAKCMASP